MEKRKILHFIADLFNIACKDNWKPEYDASQDYFYWTREKLSRDTRLVRFLDEFSLYINPRGSIEGLFIEYAKNNFLSRNEDLKPLFNALNVSMGNDIFTISTKEKGGIDHYLKDMASLVAKETLEVFSKEDIDFNRLIAVKK